MELDRQSIERRDFPIGRRGYDPRAVDAHLQAVASGVEELERTAAGRGPDSLAATAGSQVQAIVAAAEEAAAQIEREARAAADGMREQASKDAERTRADAIAQAQAHVRAVTEATATLLARVEAMDGEASKLVDSLRAGASRLTGDLTGLETGMGELYDAASGRGPSATPAPARQDAPEPSPSAVASEPARRDAPEPARAPVPPLPSPRQDVSAPAPTPVRPDASEPAPAAVSVPPPSSSPPPTADNGDLDGARLVALNMALNGDSREQTDRYLAENYELPDRQQLLDEVYAAIEG